MAHARRAAELVVEHGEGDLPPDTRACSKGVQTVSKSSPSITAR
jgi:hypothetical protein